MAVRYRTVVTLTTGDVVYGAFAEFPSKESPEYQDYEDRVKKFMSLSCPHVETCDGDLVSFNPNHIVCVAIEGSRSNN